MSSQTLNLSLPKELVKKLDDQAKKEYSSRSDYIRKAIVNQLNTEQAVNQILDTANAKGRKMGITTEQQVYSILRDK